jgi:conjugal transfer pilus assembly protein TraK
MDKTATVKVTDRVVYFATEGEQPVSLFITPENSEAVALSVTLVPCGMPPRELELRLEGGRYPFTPVSTGQARPGEEQQPYVDALLRVMRALALEEIPQCFNLRRFGAGDTAAGHQEIE